MIEITLATEGQKEYKHLLVDEKTCQEVSPNSINYECPNTLHIVSHAGKYHYLKFDEQLKAFDELNASSILPCKL